MRADNFNEPWEKEPLDMEIEQQEEDKDKKKKRLLLLLLLLLLLFLCCCPCLWYVKGKLPKGEGEPVKRPVYDVTKDDSVIEEELETVPLEKTDTTMMNICITSNPIYSGGNIYLNMQNKKINNNPQIYELYLNENGENVLIYKSGTVPVGTFLINAKADLDLGNGNYECLALIREVDAETGELLGDAGAKVTLTVR